MGRTTQAARWERPRSHPADRVYGPSEMADGPTEPTTSEPAELGLDDAYAVETPDDNRRLYRAWADTYDSGFARAKGYVYHEGVASLFAARRTHAGPVLDVGCGTGLVGQALRDLGCDVIDGIDISREMLAKADEKGIYRSLTEVDLTLPLPIESAGYDGVVSVGTFTHGHLGPEPLTELVRIARPGAPFALGINADHFRELGFDQHLVALVERGDISEPVTESIRIYSADAPDPDEHTDDLALVLLFSAR